MFTANEPPASNTVRGAYAESRQAATRAAPRRPLCLRGKEFRRLLNRVWMNHARTSTKMPTRKGSPAPRREAGTVT
ncbi:hypothetical protein [Kibdelosporangium philippinense]|uniref:hypothetical protein n=1 Tax=Kibdelosporangium philippinense TaxID=211113 RepID=UPI003620098F